MARLTPRWLLVGANESNPPRRPGIAAPSVGDLVRINGQSITKEQFAPFGGCAGRIESIDDKKQTFVLVYTALLAGLRETDLSLSQLVSLHPFDVAVYEAAERGKKEKRRQQAKASRIKKKEKDDANKNWPEQFKELQKQVAALTPIASTPLPQHIPSEPHGSE
jgi:hypothetical protein